MNKINKTVFTILLLFFGFCMFCGRTLAESEEEKLKRLSDEITAYENELNRLDAEANTLSNLIAQFNAQIKLTQLKISQTEEKILLLGGRIDQLKSSLDSLNLAYMQRVAKTYKMTRFSEKYLLFLSFPNINDAINSFSYLKKLQEADIDLLARLEKAQNDYQEQKSGQEELQKELESQKKSLASQKYAKDKLLEQTKNDEKKYQSLLAEAKSQLTALKRYVSGQGGATILSNQTVCNDWGCYYNQRDSLWGNIGLGGSSYSMAEYGCLVTSVSMIASHYGKNIKPIDIALVSDAFFPGTGYLNDTFSVNGISVKKTHASKSLLDSELSAGRPVVAGLYSGPDHFIVILRKDGANYIMHDPFMENGHDKPLTDKYQVSDISTLRLISFY